MRCVKAANASAHGVIEVEKHDVSMHVLREQAAGALRRCSRSPTQPWKTSSR